MFILFDCIYIMASPGQKHGNCGHVMAMFDLHNNCVCYRKKGVSIDPCVLKKDCELCNSLTSDQKSHLTTPSYNY